MPHAAEAIGCLRPPAGIASGRAADIEHKHKAVRSLTPTPRAPYLRPSERHPPEAAPEIICMLPWALVQQNSCQAGVVHICAESGGGRPSSQSTSASDRAPVGEGEAVAVGLVEDDGEEVQGLVS